VLTRYSSTTFESNALTLTPTERRPTSLKSTFSWKVSRSSSAENKRSFLPQDTVPVRDLHDTFHVSLYAHRKPLPSTSQVNLKDCLVERFERLKLPWNGKSQPRSVVPAVFPPLSSSNTTTYMNPAQSRRPSFQATKKIWNKMAGSRATEPRLSAISSAHEFGGDFGAQPQTTLGAGSKAQQPIVIDDSDREGGSNSTVKRYRKSFQRRVRANDRMPALPRQRTTSIAQQLSRRSRSPNMSDSSSWDDRTPTSSGDVSYPNLSSHLARLQTRQREHGKVRDYRRTEASTPQEELDRKLAEQLERDEMDKYRIAQGLYAQQTTASGQPSTSSTARGRRNRTHQRVRSTTEQIDLEVAASNDWMTQLVPAVPKPTVTTAVSHQGTRDDPIDLDSESSSDPGESDRAVLGVRTGVEDDGMDPMDVDEGGWNSHDEHDAIDTSLDAMLARRLHDEEEQSRRVVVPTRACVVCDDIHQVADLPSLASCDHVPQTCATCYSGWVGSQLESSGWREAKCPEDQCRTKMTYHEIQQIATPEIFQRYDTFIARAAISEDRKFHHYSLP
jgi:hypothetical protein